MLNLSSKKNNIYSQFGEDGIIEEVFNIIGVRSRICVEFGAWDGFYLSNTANLWTNGWKGVLIEGDKKKYKDLVIKTEKYNCLCINTFVSTEGYDCLENIFERFDIPFEIDFLSIDIDGDDYYIFNSMGKIKPRLISCEFNPTIPIHLELIPQKGNFFGCSALSLYKLATSKGYCLVAATDTNLLFVRQEDIYLFKDYVQDINLMFSEKYLIYYMAGYDGEFILSDTPTYGFGRPSKLQFEGENKKFPLWEVLKRHMKHFVLELILR